MRKLIGATVLFATVTMAGSDEAAWRDHVPTPIFDKNPALTELYYTAWKQAWDHVKTQPGLPQSPYMDEGLWDNTIWIWDTCFMVHFCKYAPDSFPGVQSLRNFYVPIHDMGTDKSKIPLVIQHPDNPPLFAWVEYDYCRMTNDTAHLQTLMDSAYLQKHFEWFETVQPGYRLRGGATAVKRVANGYHWSGTPSGMDNTPRGRNIGYNNTLWLDAAAQQGLSALYISRMYSRLNDPEKAKAWMSKYDALKQLLNTRYWNDTDGFYYDIDVRDNSFVPVKTPASFWPLMAEMASDTQAKRQIEAMTNPEIFGGTIPWPTIDRKAPEFNAEHGDYWRGGVWLPTAYMGIKAAEKYGYFKEAAESAENLVGHMLKTYQNYTPHTIWECYRPNAPEPSVNHGHRVREDFCGWSALGPISLFIENILGFHDADGVKRELHWYLHQQERHGIEKLRFAGITTNVIYDGKGTVNIKSNQPYTLIINGKRHAINAGGTTLKNVTPVK